MQKFPAISALCVGLGLSLTLSLGACDGDDAGNDGTADGTSGDGDGDGDGDTTGDGDGDTTGGECFPVPEECQFFISCISDVLPSQAEMVAAQFGEGSACWCSGNDQAQDCFETCVDETAAALDAFPTATACQENTCTLDELDPEQPYGPVVDGACPDWGNIPQVPALSPFGVPGSFCSPACGGVANTCPDHTQTSADGTCLFNLNGEPHCASRCYEDSGVLGGTQCQCGAVCQPQGSPDGEGNVRGICTFE